jgi:putative endonuclease
MQFTVYILGCVDDSLYTGKTVNLERRLWEHQHGVGSDYTKRRRPVRLLWAEVFPSETQAYVVERKIKGWTRAKKMALIRGDFDTLHELSKSTEKRKRENNGKHFDKLRLSPTLLMSGHKNADTS